MKETNGKVTTAANALILWQEKILLVRPKGKGYWLLPGGKHSNGESDIQCLFREVCDEELPRLMIRNLRKYRKFIGMTPSSLKNLSVNTFFADVIGDFQPGAEIEDAVFFKDPEGFYLTHTTREIIKSLRDDGFLPKRN